MTYSQRIGPYTAQVLDSSASTDAIRKRLMRGREMLVRPASEWQAFSWSEQRLLLHETATFVAPTEELVDFLDREIGEDSAVEICCGNGWIGRELDLKLTDSKAHEKKEVRMMYRMCNNPVIHYPADVLKMEAQRAVTIYHPHTVLACYPAFRWEDDRQIGSDYGVDFHQLLKRVKKIIIVGNDHVHGGFSFMDIPHQEIHIDGMITRSEDRSADRIYIFKNKEYESNCRFQRE